LPGVAAIKIRPVRPAGWWFDVLLLIAFAALTLALARGFLLDADLAVRDWVDAHRPAPAFWIATVVNFLGAGGWVLLPLSGLLAAALAWRARSPRPFLIIGAAMLLTGVAVQPIKLWLHRGFPHNELLAHPERLFSDPAKGLAYPSGHVVNAVVWYGVIVVLLSLLCRRYGRSLPATARRLIRIAPPAIVFCSTTYLGHHWITDSIAGLLIGLLLDRLLSRFDWDDVLLPARSPDPPPAG
jgi:membrane-associated phospholipid phosphatase